MLSRPIEWQIVTLCVTVHPRVMQAGPGPESLSRQYARDPIVTPIWMQLARAKFHAAVSPGQEDWVGQIAFARGSFSTLLGFTVHEDRVEGLALGDTVLFIETPTSCVTIPAMNTGAFHKNPVLFSSHPGKGAFSDSPQAISDAVFVVAAPCNGWSGSRLFAATDALAEWILADQEQLKDRLSRLAALTCRADFSALVEAEITTGRMRYDDTTVILVEP